MVTEVRQQEHIVRFDPYPEDKILHWKVHTFDLDKARATTRSITSDFSLKIHVAI